MKRAARACLLMATLGSNACGPGEQKDATQESGFGSCERWDEPTLILVRRQADRLVPLESGDVLDIDMSPQGGFNFQLMARGRGFVSSDAEPLRVRVTLEVEGIVTHDIDHKKTFLECTEEEGLLIDTHVGADLLVVRSAEQVASYHQKEAILRAKVTNHHGGEARASQKVVLSL